MCDRLGSSPRRFKHEGGFITTQQQEGAAAGVAGVAAAAWVWEEGV